MSSSACHVSSVVFFLLFCRATIDPTTLSPLRVSIAGEHDVFTYVWVCLWVSVECQMNWSWFRLRNLLKPHNKKTQLFTIHDHNHLLMIHHDSRSRLVFFIIIHSVWVLPLKPNEGLWSCSFSRLPDETMCHDLEGCHHSFEEASDKHRDKPECNTFLCSGAETSFKPLKWSKKQLMLVCFCTDKENTRYFFYLLWHQTRCIPAHYCCCFLH